VRRPDIAFLNAADALERGYNPATVAIWLRAYATQIQQQHQHDEPTEKLPEPAGDTR
jgi:hypothetical protein